MSTAWTTPEKSFVAALLIGAATLGCPKADDDAPPAQAAATSKPRSGTTAAPPPSPAGVRALCEALHTLPVTRKAACCGAAPGVVLTDECARNLSGAVGEGAIAVDLGAVKTCTTALDRTFEGCAWVGPHMPPVPEACVAALEGRREEGQACRSSLECAEGLRCAGAGPEGPGRCRPPSPAGEPCAAGEDPLAPYLRVDVDAARPPCAGGFCDRGVCRLSVGAGGDCASSAQCGEGLRCAGGRCIDGARGAEQAPCSGGDCQPGLRCVGQTCMAPRPEGAPCIQHAQCEAGCVQNICKMVCSAAELLRGQPTRGPPRPVEKPGFKPRIPPLKTP